MLRDIKGPDVFVRAIAKLADLGIHPTAHIVGDGPDRDSYRGLVDKLNLDGQIAFHDPLPARQAFAMARNVVVPSRGESMPYIVLETIAAQIPIIATRVGGIPEIFGREKSALVEPGDEDALAEAMMSHLDDQAAAGEQARERARRIAGRFSVEHMASMIESAYRSAERGRRTDALRANALAAGKTR